MEWYWSRAISQALFWEKARIHKVKKNQLSREKKLEGHISHHRSMKFQSLELPMMSSGGAFYLAFKMKIGLVLSFETFEIFFSEKNFADLDKEAAFFQKGCYHRKLFSTLSWISNEDRVIFYKSFCSTFFFISNSPKKVTYLHNILKNLHFDKET